MSNALEAAVRAELSQRAGRNLTEAEWAGQSSHLLEFLSILRAWDAHAQDHRNGSETVVEPLPKAA